MDEHLKAALEKYMQHGELTDEERQLVAKHFSRKGPKGWATAFHKGQEVEIGGISGVVAHAGRKALTVRIKE